MVRHRAQIRFDRSIRAEGLLVFIAFAIPTARNNRSFGRIICRTNNRDLFFIILISDRDYRTVDNIAVATETRPSSSSRRFLAAYQTGCPVDSRIRDALFDINDAKNRSGIIFNYKFTDDLSVSDGGTIVEGPEVVFSDSGFYVPSGSNDSEPIGGWTVVWTE